ncbi:MAG TPA: NAD(P)-dependent oxidoreductase [Ktedonobacterales bacterium]|nr:NAD(P)-dependent oxidoreductase [Ktedonobacterales bacterium]
MKIAVFGASGMIGQRVTQEALARGHQVTALVRHPENVTASHPNLTVQTADALDPASVAAAVAGHDVVVSSISPNSQGPSVLVASAHSLLEGVEQAGVKRLLVVGGAGSLEVAPGLQLVDSPEFPAAWRPGALAHREGLNIYRQSQGQVDWTYFSPANFIAPGERTGAYRTGTEQLVINDKGESRISAEDYAVALVDEIETPRFVRQRFTAAY